MYSEEEYISRELYIQLISAIISYKSGIFDHTDRRLDSLHAIDLYTALSNKPKMFPDKIHPNAEGAAVMAKVIANIVAGIEHPKPKASK